jgi:hypothetical protein
MQSEQAAGALVLCKAKDFKRTWILEAVRAWPPEAHGRKYTQRFVAVTIGECTACFYEIAGYATHSENVAFEHAFFVIDRFIEYLKTRSAPAKFISVIDLGAGQEPEVYGPAGKALPASAVDKLGCTLAQLREARAAAKGQEVWRRR